MTKKKKVDSKFNKIQLLKSNKFKHNIDLLHVILEDDVLYTIKDVDNLIKKYMKGVVK